jgi:hypothetical protein
MLARVGLFETRQASLPPGFYDPVESQRDEEAELLRAAVESLR